MTAAERSAEAREHDETPHRLGAYPAIGLTGTGPVTGTGTGTGAGTGAGTGTGTGNVAQQFGLICPFS